MPLVTSFQACGNQRQSKKVYINTKGHAEISRNTSCLSTAAAKSMGGCRILGLEALRLAAMPGNNQANRSVSWSHKLDEETANR